MAYMLKTMDGEYTYQLRTGDKPVFETHAYSSKTNTRMALKRMRWICLNSDMSAKAWEQRGGAGNGFPCMTYFTDNGGYRFAVYARNGKEIGRSVAFESEQAREEGYRRFLSCLSEEEAQ